MASGNRDGRRHRGSEHKSDRLAKAAQKVESASAELRRKAMSASRRIAEIAEAVVTAHELLGPGTGNQE